MFAWQGCSSFQNQEFWTLWSIFMTSWALYALMQCPCINFYFALIFYSFLPEQQQFLYQFSCRKVSLCADVGELGSWSQLPPCWTPPPPTGATATMPLPVWTQVPAPGTTLGSHAPWIVSGVCRTVRQPRQLPMGLNLSVCTPQPGVSLLFCAWVIVPLDFMYEMQVQR